MIQIRNRFSGEIIFELDAENLCDADLRDADLRDADLRGADLRGADLRGANLRDADLSYANLRCADLRDANLRCANLSGANLSGANLSGANSRGADLGWSVDESGIDKIQGFLKTHELWVVRELHREIHPAVLQAMRLVTHLGSVRTSAECFRIVSTLASECPYISEKDPTRLAYTRSSEHGAQNRQTVVKIGSYLNRVFKDTLPDHEVETIVRKFLQRDEVEFKLMPAGEIVITMMETSAQSCMTKENNRWGAERHPYRVYENPSHGWQLAVMISGGSVVSRALVNDHNYVRVYGTPTSNEYSVDCPLLRDWLNQNGFTKLPSWEGFLIDKIYHRGSLLGPYLDGDCMRGRPLSGAIILDCAGRLTFENTDGTVKEEEEEEEEEETHAMQPTVSL